MTGEKSAILGKMFDQYYHIIDVNYTDILLMCHTYFIDSAELFEYLKRKYLKKRNDDEYAASIQIGILRICKNWIKMNSSLLLPHFTPSFVSNWNHFFQSSSLHQNCSSFKTYKYLSTNPLKPYVFLFNFIFSFFETYF